MVAAFPCAGSAQSAQAVAPVAGPPLATTGTFRQHANFPSRYVASRTIDVWLPPDYGSKNKRYPVLYVHDGQNAFNPATSLGGVDWGIDETMTRLIGEKRIRPAIVVAIWNTPKRFQEYMPRKALTNDSVFSTGRTATETVAGPSLSDDYLRFLTTEVKPFIDRAYRTQPHRDDTFIMGSSMGGLISLYAISELPGIFGGAACLSTHWPAGDGAMVTYLAQHVPKASEHRLYFDHGTATLDTVYAPYQDRVDALLRGAKYRDGEHFMTRVFEGADHSERAWRQRVDVPLLFLLKR
ncbi:MAG: esterase family protein [Gemmatimonadaceae bacterium]|nr:esterase family protein [Gemmatimonadaceae bacterium]